MSIYGADWGTGQVLTASTSANTSCSFRISLACAETLLRRQSPIPHSNTTQPSLMFSSGVLPLDDSRLTELLEGSS